MQFNDLGLLMEAAVAGQGIALGRRTIIRHWLAAGLLVPVFDLAAESPHAYWLLYDRADLAAPRGAPLHRLAARRGDGAAARRLSGLHPGAEPNSARDFAD